MIHMYIRISLPGGMRDISHLVLRGYPRFEPTVVAPWVIHSLLSSQWLAVERSMLGRHAAEFFLGFIRRQNFEAAVRILDDATRIED